MKKLLLVVMMSMPVVQGLVASADQDAYVSLLKTVLNSKKAENRASYVSSLKKLFNHPVNGKFHQMLKNDRNFFSKFK